MNYTFSGFSKAGNAVVRGAIAAAQDMGHTYVGTEHLLLALVRDDTGEAAAFLLERQVYGYQVGRLLREQVGCGRRTRLSPRDFTPALSKCVDCAVIEAKAVSDGKVEPVHLLAALLEAPATAGRHGTRDYQLLKEYFDLAAEMKWPYSLIDWEWDQMGNGGNLEDAVKYAHERGVKPLLWYNSSTNWLGPTPLYRLNKPEDRAKEFEWLNKLGVFGIKVDFFLGDSISSMDYYIDLLEDAAKYNLMVNFHGATIPRGWQRTYPNLMSVEAVYGAEWYNNNGVLTHRAAAHNATLPFTRNVVGPMDYTPGTFSDSQHPHITTYAHELALPVIFESALQHMPDRPSVYYGLPEQVKQFLSALPTAWDDTKLLAGYPGTEVVMARRKGDVWYIAGINGTDEPRVIGVPLENLGLEKSCKVTWFKDGSDGKSFVTEESVSLPENGKVVQVTCLPRGGFVAVVK